MNMMFVADLRLHPDAERVPAMTPDEYDALVLDIEQRGVVVPLDILADGTILDGRHRWQVASTLGLESVPVRVIDPADPIDYMVRAAVLRRHLTTAQRKALAASLLVAEPSRSDRTVAATVGISPTTVGAVRTGLEASGQVSRLDSRTGADGRVRAVRERGDAQAVAVTEAPTPSHQEAADRDGDDQRIRLAWIDLETVVGRLLATMDKHGDELLVEGFRRWGPAGRDEYEDILFRAKEIAFAARERGSGR